MRRTVPLFLALALLPLPEGQAQPERESPGAFASAWPEIAFPLPRTELESATQDTLVALGLVVDLREPSKAVIAESTLVLNPRRMQDQHLTFYLNPGLEIQHLNTVDGTPIGFEREGAAVRLGPLPKQGKGPFLTLALRYEGKLDSSSSLFDPPEPSEAVLGEHFSFLPG